MKKMIIKIKKIRFIFFLSNILNKKKMELNKNSIILIIFVFIIIIFFSIYCQFYVAEISALLVIASTILFGYMFSNSNLFSEHFDVNHNLELSKYGNLPIDEIDMTVQEVPISSKMHNKKIDNSDIIESTITRGTTLFRPNGTGFSPLIGDINAPEYFYKYDMPLSGQQNIDEMLARKQQDRANLNKKAIDGAVMSTKNLYSKYFHEELDENEHRVWYSSEAQDIEDDWNPY